MGMTRAMIGYAASRRQAIAGVIGLGVAFLVPARAAARPKPALPETKSLRWAVCYGAMPSVADVAGLHLVVVEPDHAGPLPRSDGGPLLIAYVSLGEIEKSRPYAGEARAIGLLGKSNPHWPDATYVDLRDPRWHRLVLDRIVPPLLARGFDGIFFDTLDNAEAMQTADPSGSSGMTAGAATLVRAIRQQFPGALLMMNRGYALLPSVAGSIDLLLGEAMASHWSFAAKRYEMRSDGDWEWQAARLRDAQAANPALRLLTLDYWDPADRATIKTLYARERAAGFAPYVSTLALDRMIGEDA